MNITKKRLQEAATQEIISFEQVDKLYAFLQLQAKDVPKFTLNHVLYYFGGLIAITAMGLFLGLSWENFGGLGIVSISVIYALIGLLLTEYFKNKQLAIPAGICATFVVCLAPVAIYGFQQWFGHWPKDVPFDSYDDLVKWNRLYIELGTLVVGGVIALKYKYPFLLMPIAITLLIMTVDITGIIYGSDYTWEMRKIVSIIVGLVMLALAFGIDLKFYKTADYAFWLYLFGVIAFWGGLSAMESNSELGKFIYFCINLVMIGIGTLIARKVFLIFGAIGSFIYLSHLSYQVFQDDWLFPIALTAIGLGIIFLGSLWQKHEKTLVEKSRAKLPKSLRELLEAKE